MAGQFARKRKLENPGNLNPATYSEVRTTPVTIAGSEKSRVWDFRKDKKKFLEKIQKQLFFPQPYFNPTHRKLEGFVEDGIQGFPVNLRAEAESL